MGLFPLVAPNAGQQRGILVDDPRNANDRGD